LEFNAGAENAAQIAKLQSDTTLSAQDMQDKTSVLVADTQAKLQAYLGQLSSNTQLTTQQMATEAQKAIASANNVSSQLIARIQADNSLSIAEKNNQSQQVIAQMNNENARTVQDMTNKAALANIAANGEVNTKIQQMTNDNKNAAADFGQRVPGLHPDADDDVEHPDQQGSDRRSEAPQPSTIRSRSSTTSCRPCRRSPVFPAWKACSASGSAPAGTWRRTPTTAGGAAPGTSLINGSQPFNVAQYGVQSMMDNTVAYTDPGGVQYNSAGQEIGRV
jgi:hypothetical protein